MKKRAHVLMRPTQTQIDSLIEHAKEQLREAILFTGILKESEDTSDMLRREKNNIISAFVDRCVRDGLPKDEAQAIGQSLRTKFLNVDVPRFKDWCLSLGLNYFDAESQSRWLKEGVVNAT
ncbi:MAG: hypothetical protein AB7E61_06350 [Acholeplasmataceae bacterium]